MSTDKLGRWVTVVVAILLVVIVAFSCAGRKSRTAGAAVTPQATTAAPSTSLPSASSSADMASENELRAKTKQLVETFFTFSSNELPEQRVARLRKYFSPEELSQVDDVQFVYCYDVNVDGESVDPTTKPVVRPNQSVVVDSNKATVQLPGGDILYATVTQPFEITQVLVPGSAFKLSPTCPASTPVLAGVMWERLPSRQWRLLHLATNS